VVRVDLYAAALEAVLEGDRRRLAIETGDDDRAHQDVPLPQVVDGFERVGVVGDPEIGAHLLLLDVAGVDADHDLGLVAQLLEELHLHVGVETRQHARGVVVEEQFAAKLEVELAVEALHALENRRALLFKITFVVETDPGSHGRVEIADSQHASGNYETGAWGPHWSPHNGFPPATAAESRERRYPQKYP